MLSEGKSRNNSAQHQRRPLKEATGSSAAVVRGQRSDDPAPNYAANRAANRVAKRAANEAAGRAANQPADTEAGATTGLVTGAGRRASDLQIAANRANAQKSTGPRTEEGKQRASLNNQKRRSIRLLGLAEARTLRQEPGAAERLYHELIAPFEPAPALLASHFEDLARLRLELEAWERIRDAQLEARWQQSDIERRRAYYEMERDLPGKADEILEHGVCGLLDSPAKFKKAAEGLDLLKLHLAERNFDMEPILRLLYGKDLDPGSDRARTICIRCRKLMSPKSEPPLTADEFEELTELVEQEQRDALTAYGLHLDEKTITRSRRLALLGSIREDRWMNQQGERLRQAIDRKQWVITGLLQAIYRSGNRSGAESPGGDAEDSGHDVTRQDDGEPPSPPKILQVTKPISHLESINRSEKIKRTKPNGAGRSRPRRRAN